MQRRHGLNSTRGIELVNAQPGDSAPSGKFGRMFPLSFDVPPLSTDVAELRKLGQIGGPMEATGAPSKSQSVPLGIVFLGQFIDHDITFDPISRLGEVQDPLATFNFRTPALDLDCVYDSGPEASPHLFNIDLRNNGGQDWRGYLITGVDGTAYRFVVGEEFDDLSRTMVGRAIIGDPRNDENRVVSQLQLAFIRFHNQMMEEHHDYEEASKLTRWHYQWIIIHEFLPAMIGQDLVDEIMNNGRKFYDPTDAVNRAFIPIEFAVAAYRFGHSMITNDVRLNTQREANLFSRDIGRGFTALNHSFQVIDWSFFFENVNGRTPQMADKLDTKLAPILLDLPFIPASDERSLATRNLIRGNDFQLPAGETVAAEMMATAPTRFPANYVANMATEIANQKGTANLASGTPLWFYILAEAGMFGKRGGAGAGGEHLGPVGGSIVGETLIGILQKDPTSYLNVDPAWTPDDPAFSIGDLLNKSKLDRGIARRAAAPVV